jgi:hypothetical protein
MENINKEVMDKKEYVKTLLKKQETKKQTLLPDPILNLKYVLGYSSLKCPDIKFMVKNEDNNTLLFTSGNILVKYDQKNLRQNFFFGHSKPISHYIIVK